MKKETVPKDSEKRNVTMREFLKMIGHNYISYDNFHTGKTLSDICNQSERTGFVSTAFLGLSQADDVQDKAPKTRHSRNVSQSGGESASESDDHSDAEENALSKSQGGLGGMIRRGSMRLKKRLSSTLLSRQQEEGEDSSWQSESDNEGESSKIEKKRAPSISDSEASTTKLDRRRAPSITESDSAPAVKRNSSLTLSRRGSLTFRRSKPPALPPVSSDLRYVEELLNKTKLDELIGLEMITCLGGALENFEIKLGGEELGKSKRYRLERTGQSPEFIKPVSGEELLAKNALFCMDSMLTSFDPIARETLIGLDHEDFRRCFKNLEVHDVSLRNGFAAEVEFKRLALRKALQANPDITKLEALAILEPELHAHYLRAFEHGDFLTRYNSLQVGSALINNVVDPVKQSEDYKKAFEEQKAIIKAREALTAGDAQPLMDLRSERGREDAINGLSVQARQSNHELHAVLATYFKKMKTLHEKLDLSYFGFTETELLEYLRNQGGRLSVLDLSYTNDLMDSFLTFIVALPQLRKLVLRFTPLTEFNRKANITHLDLSSTGVKNPIFSQLLKNCSQLIELKLANTEVTRINASLGGIVRLDLSDCKVEDVIFADALTHGKALKSFSVRNSKITRLHANTLGSFSEIDVSGSRKLLAIESGVVKSDKQGNGSALRVLTANDCDTLISITADVVAGLTALYANNNRVLGRISLCDNRSMPDLAILEVNDNPVLKDLVVNPVKMVSFGVRRSPSLTGRWNDVLCRSLLTQALARNIKNPDGDALSIYLRVKENPNESAIKEYGEGVFQVISAPGLKAGHANMGGMDLSYSDVTGADLSFADLRGCTFYRTNMAGLQLGQLPLLTTGNKQHLTALAYTQDGQLFAVGDNYGVVVLLNRNLDVLHVFNVEGPVSALAFSPNGQRLAMAVDGISHNPNTKLGFRDVGMMLQTIDPYSSKSYEKTPRFFRQIYNISGGKYELLTNVFLHTQETRGLFYTHDNNYIISASDDGSVKIAKTVGDKDLLFKSLIREKNSPVLAVAISHNTPQIATAHKDGTILIWNYIQGTITQTLENAHAIVADGHTRGVAINGILWTNNGKNIISCGDDGTVKIWEKPLAKWSCKKTLLGHKYPVQCVAMDPQGHFIFSGDVRGLQRQENSLIVWEGETGEMVRRIGVDNGVYALTIDPIPRNEEGVLSWVVCVGSAGPDVWRYNVRRDGVYYALERGDLSTQLRVDNLRMTKVIALPEEAEILLKQLGVDTDAPAPQVLSPRHPGALTSPRGSRALKSDTFFPPPQSRGAVGEPSTFPPPQSRGAVGEPSTFPLPESRGIAEEPPTEDSCDDGDDSERELSGGKGTQLYH